MVGVLLRWQVGVLFGQHHATEEEYSLAISILALVGMIVPFVVLAVVCWIFWKAKKREDAAAREEMGWPSARSS